MGLVSIWTGRAHERNSCGWSQCGHNAFTMGRNALSVLTIAVHHAVIMACLFLGVATCDYTCDFFFLWLHPATCLQLSDASQRKNPHDGGGRLRPYQLPDFALLPVILTNQRHDCPHLSPGSTHSATLGISRALGFSGFGHWSGGLLPRSPFPDHLGLSCPALRCPAVRYAHG